MKLGKQGPNTVERTLRRLARERPDLLETYERGDLSANAAAIEADNRKRMADEAGDLPKHGEIGGGHSRPDIIRSDYGTDPTYALARLKRDHPEPILSPIQRLLRSGHHLRG